MKIERDISLDAMRGIAALVVFGSHSVLAFYPEFSGYLGSASVEDTARSRFWYAAVNGQGAVAFFFVLSGFVLSRPYLLTGEKSILVRGVIKRWPRLAGPVLVTVVASWALFESGAYFYEPAAALSHSSWFAHFAGAYSGDAFEPTLASAALQGAVLTFLRGDYTYDSSLWTMGYEFYGSLMVFALAFLLVRAPAFSARIGVLAAAALYCHVAKPALAPFVVGVALAAFLPLQGFRAPAVLAAAAVVLALLMCGYTPGAAGLLRRRDGRLPLGAADPLCLCARRGDVDRGGGRLARHEGVSVAPLGVRLRRAVVPVLSRARPVAVLAGRVHSDRDRFEGGRHRGVAGLLARRRLASRQVQSMVGRSPERGRSRAALGRQKEPAPTRLSYRFVVLTGARLARPAFDALAKAARRAASRPSAAQRLSSSASS